MEPRYQLKDPLTKIGMHLQALGLPQPYVEKHLTRLRELRTQRQREGVAKQAPIERAALRASLARR
jgi:hypothetical protein